MTGWVEVVRGGLVESRHRVHVAVSDGDGDLVAWTGDPERVTYLRSAAKPFQALPLVEDGAVEALGLTKEELALCCASHSGEEIHVATARSLLARAGLEEGALECGPHPPLRRAAAVALLESGREPRPIHNNCSGKHAGMLALAVHNGWRTEGYLRPEHPVQRRMLREAARWTGMEQSALGTGVDGCGVVCFAAPVRNIARAFGAFAREAGARGSASVLVEAMVAHPRHLAGTGRLCTALLERHGGELFAKTGAEGVYGAGIPARGLGVAVKVEDGGRRAAEVALLRTLQLLDVVGDGDEILSDFGRPPVRNTLGDLVGGLRAEFELEGT